MRNSVLWVSMTIVLIIILFLFVVPIFQKESIEEIVEKDDYQQLFIEGDENRGHHVVSKSQMLDNEYADIIEFLDAEKFYYCYKCGNHRIAHVYFTNAEFVTRYVLSFNTDDSLPIVIQCPYDFESVIFSFSEYFDVKAKVINTSYHKFNTIYTQKLRVAETRDGEVIVGGHPIRRNFIVGKDEIIANPKFEFTTFNIWEDEEIDEGTTIFEQYKLTFKFE